MFEVMPRKRTFAESLLTGKPSEEQVGQNCGLCLNLVRVQKTLEQVYIKSSKMRFLSLSIFSTMIVDYIMQL